MGVAGSLVSGAEMLAADRPASYPLHPHHHAARPASFGEGLSGLAVALGGGRLRLVLLLLPGLSPRGLPGQYGVGQ